MLVRRISFLHPRRTPSRSSALRLALIADSFPRCLCSRVNNFSSFCSSPRPPPKAGRLLLILPLGPHDGPDGRGREDNGGENPCSWSTQRQHFNISAIYN